MIKTETLAFQKISPSSQNRFKNRISFLYIEYAKIVQKASGVVALSENTKGEFLQKEIQIPVGEIALLSLGPGTSITNNAITSCARSGCVVQFAGGGGISENATIIPYASTSKFAIAQAKIVSDTSLNRKIAKVFYKKQFNMSGFDGSITQMRGLEGSIMRKTYSAEARKNKISVWKRNTDASDAINIGLNISNSIMYGICASLVNALGMNPALGVIHKGNPKSFLFDLADLYKARFIIPAIFKLYDSPIEDIPKLSRRTMRDIIYRHRILPDLSNFLITTFEPYTPQDNSDRLVGLHHEVEAHKNYGDENVSYSTSEELS